MNALHLVSTLQAPPTRWKNGGGWTRELLAWPSAAGVGAGSDWALRISVADIEADGPFSSFPGIERVFAVLSGEGVELTLDGQAQRLDTLSPALRFAGEAACDCRLLGGATRDFNLMWQRARLALSVHTQALDAEAPLWQGLFSVSAGRVRLVQGNLEGPWQDLAPMSLAWTESPGRIELQTSESSPTRQWWMQAHAAAPDESAKEYPS